MTKRALVIVILVAGACAKGTPATAPPISDPVPMTEGAAPATPNAATGVLAAYEKVRSLLADDEIEGVASAARELEASAKAAPGPHFSEIATSAATLGTASDIAAARASFGEVSKHLIALLASDPALARGQHVFECPMAKGYGKWVQPNSELQNPYMGKAMLACGGESDWN